MPRAGTVVSRVQRSMQPAPLKPVRTTAIGALVLMCVIWGYSWVVTAVGLRHAPPFDFAAMRVAMGAAVLFAIAKATGRNLRLPSYRMAGVLGAIQVGAFVTLSQLALLRAGPGKTSVLVFTMPFWTIVFSRFMLHERMRNSQWFAVGLTVVGLTLIVAPWQLGSATGSWLAICAGGLWGISTVASKRWPTTGVDPLVFTAWQLLFGCIPLGLLAVGWHDRPVDWTREFVIALLFAAVFATAIGWWLWAYVLSHTSASLAGLNALAIPCIAVLSSWLQLGERPAPLELLGMLLIGTALGLLGWLGMRAAAQTSTTI